jgi:hypothetical protein
MGCSRQVKDVPKVYFDKFHAIADTLIHGVNQGGRRIDRNPMVHAVGGIAIAVVEHFRGHPRDGYSIVTPKESLSRVQKG